MTIRQQIFDIVSDGCSDNVANNRKTSRIMKVFIEEALPLAVEAARRILVERHILAEKEDEHGK